MKNIIITGGSKGIGKELVKQALEKGHKVFTLARKKEELELIQDPNYFYSVCDLQIEKDIEGTFSQIPFQGVDVVINNAGLLINKPFQDFTYSDFLQSFQINYFAPAKIIQLLQNQFNPNAHIVNITTMGAVQGSVKFPGLTVYGGTKASLIHLTEILAEEWKEKPLHINCLALGAVQTDMLQQAFPDFKADIQPAEMATYILEFALNQAAFFNGKLIQVSSSTP